MYFKQLNILICIKKYLSNQYFFLQVSEFPMVLNKKFYHVLRCSRPKVILSIQFKYNIEYNVHLQHVTKFYKTTLFTTFKISIEPTAITCNYCNY